MGTCLAAPAKEAQGGSSLARRIWPLLRSLPQPHFRSATLASQDINQENQGQMAIADMWKASYACSLRHGGNVMAGSVTLQRSRWNEGCYRCRRGTLQKADAEQEARRRGCRRSRVGRDVLNAPSEAYTFIARRCPNSLFLTAQKSAHDCPTTPTDAI